MPLVGHVVHYVTATPHGNYVLPAEVDGDEGEGVIRVRIFTDMSGGTEWVTHATHDPEGKHPGTWHEKEEKA